MRSESRLSRLIEWMDRRLYPRHGDNWDDVLFREVLESRIGPDSICLDYGAGRGKLAQMNFKGRAAFVAGVDPDEAVRENPALDEAQTLDLADNVIPYEDETFDVVFADNVAEHVTDPTTVLREIHRVLKPGGSFFAKTPNRWHYVPLVATLTPTWFHRLYNRLRGRDVVDTFPTAYRLNSRRAVCRHADRCGFEVGDLQRIEGRPEYLRISAITYACGFLYERAVNATNVLEPFRCVLIFELRKPG